MNETVITPVTPVEEPKGKLVVSIDEAAEMLGICKRTVERERDRGTLRCLRIGRHWKVRVAEVHAYLRRLEAEQER